MLTSSRGTAGAAAPRRLNEPRPIEIRTDDEGRPVTAILRGRRLRVVARSQPWRTDDRWWTERPVARTYYTLALEDGGTVTVFRDEIDGRWWRQRYD